ncbi:MAG: hypothetical protein QM756_31210 [Polyangiaceae bacterium]
MSASGAKAFTAAGGRDLFADFEIARTSARRRQSAPGTAAALDQLDAGADAGHQRALARRADRLQAASERRRVRAARCRFGSPSTSTVGAVDPFEAYSKVTSLSQSLQQAVQVSRQVLDLGDLWNR